MELTITQTVPNILTITCDGQLSHTIPLPNLLSEKTGDKITLTNPVETGKRLFDALFREGMPARAAWNLHPKRILLVAENAELDAIPWEYLHGPNGFIVLDVAFVRGLPISQRQPAPNLSGAPLHIVAVPSNPIDHDIARLDIEGEWTRLKESLQGLETALTLERARPPTLEQARRLVANQRNRALHFMGHGGHTGADSFLVFEDERGAPKLVTAQEFIRRLEDTTFLVTLNACVSATPGETEFSNMARALTQKGVPYALGMRFSIQDNDAKAFSRTFYDELARGSSVENALRQARNSLAESKNPWAVGTPVLYTSLSEAAQGFETPAGKPRIDEHQPRLEVFALPRAEGAFQGRVDELLTLGQALTGEPRPKLLTIHGTGGQGKTALAREAVERFAHAWPGGVWAVSLEDFYGFDRFTLELARLFKIDMEGVYKQVSSSFPNLEIAECQQHVQQELERRLHSILNNQRALLVLDNAETFIEAVNAKNSAAIDLAIFLRDKVLGTQTGLLVTSRDHLGWPGEQLLELDGLSPDEGARLFWQSTPKRDIDAIGPLAQEISRKVEGHPLSLRLLGGAFDTSDISLDEFIHEVEATLLQAADKYKHEDHRHHTLYASIETSVRYLNDAHKALLSALWIFHAPFELETIARIFNLSNLPEAEAKAQEEQIAKQLYTLVQRGLLMREIEMLADGSFLLYRTPPTVRLFAQHYLEQFLPEETLCTRQAGVYTELLHNIYRQMDRTAWASYLALRCRADLEFCADWVIENDRGWYANRLGQVLQYIGDRQVGLRWMEQAMERAQGIDQKLELHAIHNMAGVYSNTGNPGKALKLYQQALTITREVGDHVEEATILSNMANVYHGTGQPAKALELYQQVLTIMREGGDLTGKAASLNGMALVYHNTGNPSRALELFQQALPIAREEGNRAGEAITLNNMALVYSKTGNPSRALELFQQALPIHREVGDRAGEVATLNNMATVYRDTGQPAQALELYQQALPLMREVGDRYGEAVTLNNMAVVYGDTGCPDQELKLLKQALLLRREVGDRAGESNTLNNMASVYGNTGYPDRALELYQQALSIAREVGDRAGEAETLNNMAGVYSITNRPAQALELCQRALPLMREVGDRTGEAATLNNMALVYSNTGNSSRALELYQQALPIRREVGDRAGEATTLNNMAAVYRDAGQPAQALELYQQALPLMREVGDRAGETTILDNMAMVYGDTGNPSRALELYQQALPIYREVGDHAGEATTLSNMAAVYRDTDQPSQALELFQQILPLMREVGDRAGEAATLNSMADVYYNTNQSAQALELFQQALPLMREVGNRTGEATTLIELALVYRDTDQPVQALELFQQALPLIREVGDRAGEAATLNSMADVYCNTNRSAQALELYQQALLLMREVGDRTGEASTLNDMAGVYRATGQPIQALKLYQKVLPITREMGDRAGEATTLNNMAGVYRYTDQPIQALEFYQQVLPITRAVGDCAGEATTLYNMAGAYRAMGQHVQALESYQQALLIAREAGDRAREVSTLNDMAGLYSDTGQPGQALELYQQILPIQHEIGDRAEEAATLRDMALVYSNMGQPSQALELYQQALPLMRAVGNRAKAAVICFNMAQLAREMGQPNQALEFYEQALPLMREVGNRAGEAATLNNMGEVYRVTGQPGKTLELLNQALPLMREGGDRAGEATTLFNMAQVYSSDTSNPGEALKLLEQALPIRREMGDLVGEATVLSVMSVLLYNDLARSQEAIQAMEQAIGVLQNLGLNHDASGATVEQCQELLNAMKSGNPLGSGQAFSGLTPEQVQIIAANTIAVFTDVPEKRGEWREAVSKVFEQVKAANLQAEIEFLSAILSFLDGKRLELFTENPYANVIQKIVEKLSKKPDQQDKESPLPGGLPADFVPRCVAGLKGSPQDKQALFGYLGDVVRCTTTSEAEKLVKNVQLALFGQDPASLGADLPEPYAAIWQAILAGLK